MRYNFSLAPKIKGYIEWQLSHYYEDKRQLEETRNSMIPSGTANYSPMGGHGGPGDPTANTVEKMLTNPYIVTAERNVRAIERALDSCDETSRKLIDLVYWKQAYTMVGAAQKANIGKTQAYSRINAVLCHIALEMGLVSI